MCDVKWLLDRVVQLLREPEPDLVPAAARPENALARDGDEDGDGGIDDEAGARGTQPLGNDLRVKRQADRLAAELFRLHRDRPRRYKALARQHALRDLEEALCVPAALDAVSDEAPELPVPPSESRDRGRGRGTWRGVARAAAKGEERQTVGFPPWGSRSRRSRDGVLIFDGRYTLLVRVKPVLRMAAFWPSPERTRFTCWIAPLPITMSTIGTATRSTGAKTTRAWPWSGALMPRMAAEAGCAAMAGTAAAIAAGTGPAETGATCVFGGASAAAQASVAAARRNARAMFLEPARAVRGPLMPGDVYDVYAMTRRSLLRSRTEESQPRCRESDR